MNNVVNNKRVFYVQPHRPVGFGEALGKRGDIRLDMLEQKSPDGAALEILSAAHAYQTSSARDELAQHYQARADLLSKTPNLLIVSTNVTVLAPGAFWIAMPSAGRLLKKAPTRAFCTESKTLPTSFRRTGAPLRYAIIRFS